MRSVEICTLQLTNGRGQHTPVQWSCGNTSHCFSLLSSVFSSQQLPIYFTQRHPQNAVPLIFTPKSKSSIILLLLSGIFSTRKAISTRIMSDTMRPMACDMTTYCSTVLRD